MIPSKRIKSVLEEMPQDESTEYEWAEFNLPDEFMPGLTGDDEDELAFIGFGIEPDVELPEGSA